MEAASCRFTPRLSVLAYSFFLCLFDSSSSPSLFSSSSFFFFCSSLSLSWSGPVSSGPGRPSCLTFVHAAPSVAASFAACASSLTFVRSPASPSSLLCSFFLVISSSERVGRAFSASASASSRSFFNFGSCPIRPSRLSWCFFVVAASASICCLAASSLVCASLTSFFLESRAFPFSPAVFSISSRFLVAAFVLSNSPFAASFASSSSFLCRETEPSASAFILSISS